MDWTGVLFLACIVAAIVAPVVAIVLGMRSSGKMPWQRRLRDRGEVAEAVIVDVKRTAVTFNQWNDRMLKLTLEVRPRNGTAFTATADTLVARHAIGAYQPGTIVQVKYDPAKPSRVLVL